MGGLAPRGDDQAIALHVRLQADARRQRARLQRPISGCQSAAGLLDGLGGVLFRRCPPLASAPGERDLRLVGHDAGRQPRLEGGHLVGHGLAPGPPGERRREVEGVPGLFAHHHREGRVEHQAVGRAACDLQVLGDVLVAALLVAAHQQPHGVGAGQAAVAQGGHGQQGLHQRSLVVGRAAPQHEAVADRPLEGRDGPLVRLDRLHVAVHQQAQHGRALGPGQIDLGDQPRRRAPPARARRRSCAQPGLLVAAGLVVAGHRGKPQHLRQQRHAACSPGGRRMAVAALAALGRRAAGARTWAATPWAAERRGTDATGHQPPPTAWRNRRASSGADSCR